MFLWDVWLEQRNNSRAKGPELTIPRKFAKRENLDKTGRIYNKEGAKLQLVGTEVPQEYSAMIVFTLIDSLHGLTATNVTSKTVTALNTVSP